MKKVIPETFTKTEDPKKIQKDLKKLKDPKKISIKQKWYRQHFLITMKYHNLTIKSENRKTISLGIQKISLKNLLNKRGKFKTKIAEYLKTMSYTLLEAC